MQNAYHVLIVLNEDSVCIGVARVGSDSQNLQVSTLSEMTTIDLGPPLHSLVIVGQLHPLEADMLRQFASVTRNALCKLCVEDATWNCCSHEGTTGRWVKTPKTRTGGPQCTWPQKLVHIFGFKSEVVDTLFFSYVSVSICLSLN